MKRSYQIGRDDKNKTNLWLHRNSENQPNDETARRTPETAKNSETKANSKTTRNKEIMAPFCLILNFRKIV